MPTLLDRSTHKRSWEGLYMIVDDRGHYDIKVAYISLTWIYKTFTIYFVFLGEDFELYWRLSFRKWHNRMLELHIRGFYQLIKAIRNISRPITILEHVYGNIGLMGFSPDDDVVVNQTHGCLDAARHVLRWNASSCLQIAYCLDGLPVVSLHGLLDIFRCGFLARFTTTTGHDRLTCKKFALYMRYESMSG